MPRLSLDLLQQFVLVARLGNLSRAATQAHLTVSALSHQMRQLEQRVERKLFDRGPRGVTLTAEGRRLLEAVQSHMEGLEHALAAYRRRRDEALTVNTLSGVMSGWLVPRLPTLLAAHPELEINLQSSSALVDFESDAVDVAIRYGRGQWAGLESEYLFDEWIVPVAAPALLRRLSRLDRGTLAGWPLLGDPSGRWQDWFKHVGGRPPKRYVAHFDTTDALQRAALEGLGVALGRMVMARPLIEAGSLHRLGNQHLKISEAYYLVYPARRRGHAGFELFRAWLLGESRSYAKILVAPSGHANASVTATPKRSPKPTNGLLVR